MGILVESNATPSYLISPEATALTISEKCNIPTMPPV